MTRINRISWLVLVSALLIFHHLDIGDCGRSGGGGGGSRSPSSSGSSGGSRYGSSSSSGSYGGSSPSSGSSGSSASRYGSSSSSGNVNSGSSASRVASPSSSGNSFGSSSSSRVSGGNANPSSSGVRSGGSPAAGGTGTRWGSSGASGSSAGGSGVARTNYQAAGGSAVRSSGNRPAANAPAPSQHVPMQPVQNTHVTTINNYHGGGYGGGGGFGTGSLLLAGAGGMVGGYMLGSMLTRSSYHDSFGCCYGCGYCDYRGQPPPYYYNSYVPYRYRYETPTNGSGATTSASVSTTPGTQAQPPRQLDLCTLARWNMELPFTELPNMALTFLANDNISGNSIADKSRFLYEFLNTTATPYGTMNATSNVFTIPASYDLKICNFNIARATVKRGEVPQTAATVVLPSNDTTNNGTIANITTAVETTTEGPVKPWFAGVAMTQWREMVRKGDRSICFMASYANIPECQNGGGSQGPEEPFFTGVKQLLKFYSNISTDLQMTTDMVASAKRCFPTDSLIVPPKEMIPCLDYSIDSGQVQALQNTTSIFGNEEVCKKYLNPDISKCHVPPGSSFQCTTNDLVNLNVFARNYYLCAEPVDPELVLKLENQQSGKLNNEQTTSPVPWISNHVANKPSSSSAGTSLISLRSTFGSIAFVSLLVFAIS